MRAETYSRAFTFAQQQVRALASDHPDLLPVYTVSGRWDHEGDAWTNWCEGFPAGMMWIFFERTGEAEWRELAERYSTLLKGREFDREVHDQGFLFWPSWKRWYDLDGVAERNEVVVQAGRTQAMRFDEKGRYLRSFLAADSTVIDIMMNVNVIFHAARDSADEDLARIAHEHCRTTIRCLVRGDGSTNHEGLFDLSSGQYLRAGTHQGWRPDSAWARGQAWALYGFGEAFELTGDRRYLDVAHRCADFYVASTPGGVPPNDWDEPDPERAYESSAAAAAAGGLWRLAKLTDDSGRRAIYRGTALKIMDRLVSPEFLANETPEWEGILRHGTYHERNGLGVDESVMFGDYFFVEALAMMLEDGFE